MSGAPAAASVPGTGIPRGTLVKVKQMPRYVVERDFPDGLNVPINADGAKAMAGVREVNSAEGVSWVHTYVSTDHNRKSFCVYDAPNPEAIRRAGARNNLPVGRITEVKVLDAYFYH